jgi:hypothetical protein
VLWGGEHPAMEMPPRVADEEQETRHWMEVLRDGTREQEVAARTALAHLYEGHGLLDHTIGLLESNARAGVRDRALFRRLAALYRRAGRDDDAALAEVAATLERQPGQARRAVQGLRSAPSPLRLPAMQPVPRKKSSLRRTLCLASLGCGGLLLLLTLTGLLGGADRDRLVPSQPAVGTAGAPVAVAPPMSERRSTPLPTVGDSAEGDTWSMSLRRIGTATILQNILGKQQAHGLFVIVTMRATNKTQQTAALNARDLKLAAIDGTAYEVPSEGRTALQGEPRPILLSDLIQPGLSRDLREVFDVDPSTKDFILEAPGGVRFHFTIP